MISFVQTTKWIEDVRRERGDDVIIVLVGNKIDLDHLREVPREMGAVKAEQENALFIETSAKVGYNIKQLFKRIGEALPEDDDINLGQSEHEIKLSEGDSTEKQCSCWCTK